MFVKFLVWDSNISSETCFDISSISIVLNVIYIHSGCIIAQIPVLFKGLCLPSHIFSSPNQRHHLFLPAYGDQ